MGNDREKVIAYFSRTLTRPEQNYCIRRKELMAVVKLIKHLDKYLYSQKSVLRIDHSALQWLLNFKGPERQIARWIQQLQEYNFQIQQHQGFLYRNADGYHKDPVIWNVNSINTWKRRTWYMPRS